MASSGDGGDDKQEVLRVLREQLQEANRRIEEYRETLESVLDAGAGSNDVVEIVEDQGEIGRLREQLTERQNWIQAVGDVVGMEGTSDDGEGNRTRILEAVKEIKRKLDNLREVARPLVNLMKDEEEEDQGAAGENVPPMSTDQGSPPADLDISSPPNSPDVAGTSTSEDTSSSSSPVASTSTSSGSVELFPNNSPPVEPEVNEGLGKRGRKRQISFKEEEDSPPSQVRRQSDAAKFQCPWCNSAYLTFGKLKGHLFEKHDNSSLLGYQEGCANCQKAYRTKIDLSKHVITEHGFSSNNPFITQDSNSISVIVNGVNLGNSSNEA